MLAALAPAAPARADDESRLSGILQLDLTNAYFFRGILQERDGLIAQPWAELYVSLYSAEDGPIRDVTLGAGVWTSIHSEKTLAADSPESVYETDWYPLLSVGFAKGLNLTTTYYFYTSPNDAFNTHRRAELHARVGRQRGLRRPARTLGELRDRDEGHVARRP